MSQGAPWAPCSVFPYLFICFSHFRLLFLIFFSLLSCILSPFFLSLAWWRTELLFENLQPSNFHMLYKTVKCIHYVFNYLIFLFLLFIFVCFVSLFNVKMLWPEASYVRLLISYRLSVYMTSYEVYNLFKPCFECERVSQSKICRKLFSPNFLFGYGLSWFMRWPL